MTSDRVRQIFVWLFVAGFFAFLFGPLLVMAVTAFNTSSFPRVTPWECFTVEWFDVLMNDKRLMQGMQTSLLIGFGVVLVAVPLGLAGALLLTQVPDRARPWYYTVLISPILVPGVVLGISTLIFWDRMGQMMFGDSVFYNGYFLTILGQATFISAYTMLVFIARLQRFDTALEEAALDLGATHVQTFRRITLPFLKPAIGSAAVLAFLASFENYNTTVFTIVSESTLTTVLASKVRYGINPSISALAVVIIVITLFGACYYELAKRREEKAAANEKQAAAGDAVTKQRRFIAEPATWIILAVFIAGLGTAFVAGSTGVPECKQEVLTEKRARTAERIKALQARQKQTQSSEAPAPAAESATPRSTTKGTENFQNIFQSDNLGGQKDAPGADAADKPESGTAKPRKGTENFQGLFQQETSDDSSEASAPAQEPVQKQPEKVRPGTGSFNGIFSPDNLQQDSGSSN